MTDLNIDSERCEELCDIIQKTIMQFHDQGVDKVSGAEVIQKALEYAKNDNEVVFISVIAGEYHAAYTEARMRQGQGEDILADLLSSMGRKARAAAN